MVRTPTVTLFDELKQVCNAYQRLHHRWTGLCLAGFLSVALLTAAWVPPAAAAVLCKTVALNNQPQQVCILKITRSAKQYWEYRASASVDGKTRPTEVYDCRQRVRIRQDGKRILIDQDAVGTIICQFFDR